MNGTDAAPYQLTDAEQRRQDDDAAMDAMRRQIEDEQAVAYGPDRNLSIAIDDDSVEALELTLDMVEAIDWDDATAPPEPPEITAEQTDHANRLAAAYRQRERAAARTDAAYKAEIDRLRSRKVQAAERCERGLAWLRAALEGYHAAVGEKRVELPAAVLSMRKQPLRVNITDADACAADVRRQAVEDAVARAKDDNIMPDGIHDAVVDLVDAVLADMLQGSYIARVKCDPNKPVILARLKDTGELPDGCAAVQPDPAFSIKTRE